LQEPQPGWESPDNYEPKIRERETSEPDSSERETSEPGSPESTTSSPSQVKESPAPYAAQDHIAIGGGDEVYKHFEQLEQDQKKTFEVSGTPNDGVIQNSSGNSTIDNNVGETLKKLEQKAGEFVDNSGYFYSVDEHSSTLKIDKNTSKKTLKDEGRNPILTITESFDENGVRSLDVPTELNKGAKGPLHYAAALKNDQGKDAEPPVYVTYHYNEEGKLNKVTNPMEMQPDEQGNLSTTDGKGNKVYSPMSHEQLSHAKAIAKSNELGKNQGLEQSLARQIGGDRVSETREFQEARNKLNKNGLSRSSGVNQESVQSHVRNINNRGPEQGRGI
jgi:hypothetical protein